MFATSDLVAPLAGRGVALSREQAYRLVTGTPERLNTKALARAAALLHLAGPHAPAVLGDRLGLGHTAVQDWSTLAGRPWASYAADRLSPTQ